MWKDGEPQKFNLRGRGIERVLGPLEADVMAVLWKDGTSSASEVRKRLLADRPIAFNTVMTILKRLSDKGLVNRAQSDHVAVFTPNMTRDELLDTVSRQVTGSLLEDFGELAIHHFVDGVRELEPEWLERLERAVQAAKRVK